ncbi:PDZ domain-containing protein [Akkermansiaceae bacterium]|nr:PDZ domain-containing protein [Akkermansiaceae bacterium]
MKTFLLSTVLATSGLLGQLTPARIPLEDQKVTDSQALDIFKALRAVNFKAREVVYPIYSGQRRVAYGISLGDGKLLTKASEVVQRRALFTASREQVAMSAKIAGIYPDHDLAVLQVPGLKAPAAEWADASNLAEGAFLSAIRADGEVQAMGVLSVRERSLKSIDQGFLGIEMDTLETGKGVRVNNVVEGSAAAEVGIRRDDVIVKIAGQEVRGFYELSTKLRRLKNGEQPEIELMRAGDFIKVKPTLKGREISEGVSRRLEQMDRMSGGQSRIRGDFGNVIQSDMELEVEDAGLPVVDLEGRIIGMVIARAGRISTLILPGDDVARALENEAQPFVPEVRITRRDQQWPEDGRRARMRRELEMLRRMMENLQRELDRE